MATSNSFVTRGLELTRQASDYEKQELYSEAIGAYVDAIKAFQTAIKYESFQASKQSLQNRITELFSRAEYLKKIQKQKKEAVPEPTGNSGNAQAKKGSGEDGDEEAKKLEDALSGAIVRDKPNVSWDDVAGLEKAKESLKEAVVLPIKFPQLFVGARKPWKGILLYGPPGTGKSFLAKAVATEVDATFFSVSSSDLMSKWVGQSERLVKTLFELARKERPSIVFIDEIDSIAGKRGDNESESTRRVKTELLVQMQGVGNDNDGLLFLGATNTPWDLDSAVRRRFEKRIYIPLPEVNARKILFEKNIGTTPHQVNDQQFLQLAQKSEGYSGADISIVVREALMRPVRRLQKATHFRLVKDPKTGQEKYIDCAPRAPGAVEMRLIDVPPEKLMTPEVQVGDLDDALAVTRKSVSQEDIQRCDEWTKEFGMEA
ncbi:putative Vacuolar protein sorting-associated protein 4A [Blattamonas nauphoetae]|uniref:Vacuolar protein sorting-associated protein 4A n=1 Tax=Blattamonas nauphoetae TaxID=2049346 RepID=A0ABQ9XIB3_9EUKA|nr:putative Vacuolar protein sorting-associated protein 4A [Blattamonas nauphoetae]